MITDTDREMMLLAIEEAQKAGISGDIPVGCVIARNGQPIAAAHNMREALGDPTAHAEIVALRAAAAELGGWRLNGCTLYVTLEPCPMCAGAILMARVSRLVYGCEDPSAGCAGSIYRIPEDPALPGFTETESGLFRTECAQLLTDFFGDLRPHNGKAGT